MSDLISRSDAIGAVKEERFPIDSDYAEGFMAALDKVEWILKEWLPSAQPETHDKRTETHSCDCIERKAAIAEIARWIGYIDEDMINRIQIGLNRLPSSQPEQTNSWCINSWCIDCKEYDTENKCCPRYNMVIKQTLDDAYRHGETEAEARFHAQQRWIPCSERLPDELAEVNITWINTNPAPYYEFTKGKPNTGSAVYYKGRWYWYSAVCADYLAEYGFSPDDDMDDAIKVIAWMPLPEPYEERRTYGN